MWGRLQSYDFLNPGLRFTPTHVGTTTSPRRTRSAETVHPHACGDDVPTVIYTTPGNGSPPRMWGRRDSARSLRARHRFTPTHVGTTIAAIESLITQFGSPPRMWGRRSRYRACSCETPVHLHACGDDSISRARPRAWAGSPPRMWGRPSRGSPGGSVSRFTPTHVGTTTGEKSLHCSFRFTPTHVGTTWDTEGSQTRRSVHPHACGDDVPHADAALRHGGSPPRMWGRRRFISWILLFVRFTPTHVGTTPEGVKCVFFVPVHPHACGDDDAGRPRDPVADGSPPRMWGRLQAIFTLLLASRFTPTHVGTTLGFKQNPRVVGKPLSLSSWPFVHRLRGRVRRTPRVVVCRSRTAGS